MSDHVRRPNRLAEEKSPYLLQHAFNPVNWYPWGEEAFDKAENEDKPIFLSIGYSTCHWCHVMERESFEDEEVAGILNENFVAIKVDREERPDIDSVYMKVCILVNGTGGWPLTILMTPKKQPFFAGTYLPKSGRNGMPGLVELLNHAAELWRKDRVKLVSSAEKTVEYLKENAVPKRSGEQLGEATLDEGFVNLFDNFDSINGGFGTRPKFPSPHNLLFLLRYWKRKCRTQALDMVEKTLQRMRLGGIFDQVGFGFHRYSTDPKWLIPHFEKMLYDQAMMCMAYTETYETTGKSEHRKAAEEILDYVLRDMVDPEGGFYSAEDADSEGREGKFYLWTETEIKELLGRDADLVAKVYDVSEEGNCYDETGRSIRQNILHLNRPLQELAAEFRISFEELESVLEKSRRVLFEARKRRVHPLKDTKILTDWNGLMIVALAKSSVAFNQPRYAEAAEKALKFIIERLQTPSGELKHRCRDGEASVSAKLDDYAFLIWGLIELYEATFKTHYLAEALRHQRHTSKHFWDAADGGFYLTSDDDEQVLIRNKEFHDSAIPSGNAVSLLNLIRLARMTGETEFEEKAETLKKAFAANPDDRVSQSTMFLVALDFMVGPAYEVVIVGDQRTQTAKEILRTLGTKFIPNKTVLLKSENDEGLEAIAEYTRSMKTKNDKTTIYVCRNYACSEPTNDTDKALEALNE